jgi:hypothetical protein
VAGGACIVANTGDLIMARVIFPVSFPLKACVRAKSNGSTHVFSKIVGYLGDGGLNPITICDPDFVDFL